MIKPNEVLGEWEVQGFNLASAKYKKSREKKGIEKISLFLIEKKFISEGSFIFMTDEEKAEEYILSLELEKGNKILQLKEVIKAIYKAHLKGLAEGRLENFNLASLAKKQRDEVIKENKKLKEQLEDLFYFHSCLGSNKCNFCTKFNGKKCPQVCPDDEELFDNFIRGRVK